jgi:hypothetical protein
MNIYKDRFAAGFTLIEIAISASIFFMVTLTVYSIFASGLRIWKKSYETKFFERRIVTGLEKFSRDLRNTFKFSNNSFEGVRFEGSDESLSFAGLIDNKVGRISYFLNTEGDFCRRQETYQEFINTSAENKYTRLIFNVALLNFSYCYIDDKDTENYKWKNDWGDESSDDIPLAVKIALTVDGERGQKEKFEKTIFMPLSTVK